MNWIAYNFAHDVSLRGSTRKPLGYFMYPQGETEDGSIDSLDPSVFRTRSRYARSSKRRWQCPRSHPASFRFIEKS